MTFADVILPLPLDKFYTYRVSLFENCVLVGCRVIVQFGNKKYYTAIVTRVYEDEDKGDIKEILSVLDTKPIVLPTQIEFWKWIASYYMCSIGEVFRAALPSVLKLESETHIQRITNFKTTEALTPIEQQIFFHLSEEKSLKISEIGKSLKINNIVPHINSLKNKGAVSISENIKDNYSAKTESRIKLNNLYTEEQLIEILDSIKRAKKQQDLLIYFLDKREKSDNKESFSISKKELLLSSNSSVNILQSLIERNILVQFEVVISRFNFNSDNLISRHNLNQHQDRAYKEINLLFREKETILLHGITSSGKTEIYIKLIEEILEQGGQVLYLVPEIALTTQITERLKIVFGDKLHVYHSRFNENERAETWTNLLDKTKRQVVLGARSAIFLPFSRLDLIIVDEEHESSYKQQDPAPRYNARDAAIIIGNINKAKVLLGTATPSIETYYNALSGKYGLVRLNQRYADIKPPRIIPVNTKDLKRRKQMKYVLSPPLITEMQNTFDKGKQVILFQNRRGFSPSIECSVCSWTPHCEHCDVSLTYHKGQRIMSCHYCGATYTVPNLCANCETPTLQYVGYGTERIEEEVQEIFSNKNIVRMDMDTTRSKRAYERIITDVENNRTDILIGTQMVSKGLDFENVSTVGILNADSLLNFPDFRAYEKTYQMLTQVSGRAGRKGEQGIVMLQTAQPENAIIDCIVNNDYKNFYETQLEERRMFKYPPFCRLISIVLKGKDENVLNEASLQFAQLLKQSFPEKVLGPTKPIIGRIQALHIRNIIFKQSNNMSSSKVREALKYYQQYLHSLSPEFKSLYIYYDVDPLN